MERSPPRAPPARGVHFDELAIAERTEGSEYVRLEVDDSLLAVTPDGPSLDDLRAALEMVSEQKSRVISREKQKQKQTPKAQSARRMHYLAFA